MDNVLARFGEMRPGVPQSFVHFVELVDMERERLAR